MVDHLDSTFTVEKYILLLERGMMNLIEFFSKNSRVNIKPGLFSVSRFSGSRNQENIFILMLANENRKLSDKNTFFSQNRAQNRR